MLHTKFRGNLPAGTREEIFLKVFTIYGHGGHLVYDQHHINNFSFTSTYKLTYKICLERAQ